MKRKLLIILSALVLSLTMIVTACTDGGDTSRDSATSEEPASSSEVTPSIEFKGDMLLNGFNSVKDMYAVKQLTEWSFSPVGKLGIVGADNFIPAPSDLESEEILNAVIAQINALPSAEEVTLADKDAVNKARRAYGNLSDEGKKKITNIEKLKAAENAPAIKNVYTLADFGGSFVNDIKGSGDWAPYSGNLVNEKEGSIHFKVKGINGNIDGAFYFALYHDGSVNAGQAGDGIVTWIRTNNKTLLFANAGDKAIGFNEGKNFVADKTYEFVYGYKVAEDYSKVTISVKASDEEGDEIVNGSVDIDSFSLSDFGGQTVKGWLTEHANKNDHKTFFLDTGNSSNVDISSVWTGVRTSDFEEPTDDDPHTASDLSPREGDGALRVYYESGAFQEILARFDNSELKGLPAAELGGMSVKIYNDSAAEKTVTLSLMLDQNQVLNVDGGEFVLAPYAWTTCKVTFDPIIIDYFADDIIGVNVGFKTKFNSVYYLDDLRVQFGKVYTEEIKALMKKVDELKNDISAFEDKVITLDDGEALEALYARYIDLPQAYRFTVSDIAILEDAIDAYIGLYNKKEANVEEKTILMLDTVFGMKQISSFAGGTAEYVTDVHQKDQKGSLKLSFDGSMDWVTIGLDTTQNGEEFDELHVWVKNASENKRAFQLSWNVAGEVAYDENGNEVSVLAGYVLPANSEWIELVFKKQFTPTEFNIISLNAGNGGIKTVDTLYVGKIVAITQVTMVSERINDLADYDENYTDENKAEVAEVRALYTALSLSSRKKVTNLARLCSIEAAIWKEGFKTLPATVDELTEYTDEYKQAIDGLRASYEALPSETKANVTDEEALLAAFEAKILTFRAQMVNTIVAGLTVKDTVYTVDEIKNIKSANAMYELMSDVEKANLADGVEDKLASLTEKIAKYSTLKELGGAFANDIIGSPDWAAYSANLKDEKEGTIVFKVKGMAAGDGALYVDIFHDGSVNAGQAGDGIAMWVRNNNNTLLFQNAGDKAIGFKDGKSIDKNKTYVFYYTYKVADDYSKLTVSVRIDEEGGETIAEGSVDLTDVSFNDFGSQTIKSWLTEHENKDNHKTFFIDTGNSSGADISSAW